MKGFDMQDPKSLLLVLFAIAVTFVIFQNVFLREPQRGMGWIGRPGSHSDGHGHGHRPHLHAYDPSTTDYASYRPPNDRGLASFPQQSKFY